MDSLHCNCISNDRRSAHTAGSLVVPPDSEIVAPVSIRSPADIPPGRCSMIKPNSTITESYGVVVSRTLVDTSDWSAQVLLINPVSDVVVLPPFSCAGSVVQVSAVTMARDMSSLPEGNLSGPLPPYLEDIVGGDSSSLLEGRAALTDLLYKCRHVFLAPVIWLPVKLTRPATKLKRTTHDRSGVGHIALHLQVFARKRSVSGTCWKEDKLKQVIVLGRHPWC